MKVIIEIECDNDAFGNSSRSKAAEVARILSALESKMLSNSSEMFSEDYDQKLRDQNGNTVGIFRVEES